ncbi:post-GPI attachment to proteins factor 6 isoform X2 [Rhynchophorus ferrugineus]|uniref:post-GPI attachment to proteins factor 6 isoform X2 n=1 Tax=Rhynchophorus ferrugineus TaxID=354439 RepID=UPI003FCDA3D6
MQLTLAVAQNKNLTLISKSRTTKLDKYESFADAVVLSLSVPENTIFASFKFVGSEEALTIFGCTSRKVSLYLKHGALPPINPDGSPFPQEFRNISRTETLSVELETNKQEVYINLTSPEPGVFYAAVFLSYEDPRLKKISQQGLTRSCNAYVDSYVYVERIDNPEIISNQQVVFVNAAVNISKYYSIFVPNFMDHAVVKVQSLEPNRAILRIQARRPPTPDSFLLETVIENTTVSAVFWTEPRVWHYIEVEFKTNPTNISFEINFVSSKFDSKQDNVSVLVSPTMVNVSRYKQYDLVRENTATSFTFSYRLPAELKNDVPLAINISKNEFSVLKFNLLKGSDIGGTLQYILAFKPRVTREGRKIVLHEEPDDHIIVGCIQNNAISVPVWPNYCTSSNSSIYAPLILNKTNDNSTLLVPYPESGAWYASFKLFCGNCTPCNCSEQCQSKFVVCQSDCEEEDIGSCVEACKEKVINTDGCASCDCDGGCLRKKSSDLCNSSIIFDVSSRPCYYGDCGKQGQCMTMVSEGTAYSTCLCYNNYRGFDCSDGSLATPFLMVLLEFLLLVLSNIFFLPVTYLAYKRQYYVEAVSYFAIFISSTFYHACDSGENIMTFCLFRLSTLQFADFFSALLAIWLTLLAMADIPTVQLSILQMSGSILIAFFVTLNRYALWIFALPSSVGVLVICISWYFKYRKYKQKFISTTYLYVKLPIGVAVVFIGLIIYSLLQTQSNYKYLHSLWHIIMATGVFFLLPAKDTFQSDVFL